MKKLISFLSVLMILGAFVFAGSEQVITKFIQSGSYIRQVDKYGITQYILKSAVTNIAMQGDIVLIDIVGYSDSLKIMLTEKTITNDADGNLIISKK